MICIEQFCKEYYQLVAIDDHETCRACNLAESSRIMQYVDGTKKLVLEGHGTSIRVLKG